MRWKKSASSRPTMSRMSVVSVTSDAGVRRDVLAIAEHGDPVTELEHLVDAVTDEQHGDARFRQTANLPEQALHLVRRQRRGRFVHDQHTDVARHRLGDLDRLLGTDAELRGQRARIDVDLELAQDLAGPAMHVAPMHEHAAAAVHEDVLRDAEVGEHQRLLVDARDAERLGVSRVAQLHGATIDVDGARIGSVQAGDDLDQRRLAGAVLPDQGVHLAGMEVDRDPSQRVGGTEALRHRDDGQQRLTCRHTPIQHALPSRDPRPLVA